MLLRRVSGVNRFAHDLSKVDALLVLDAETTRRRTTKQFIEALERTGATLIGVVLNGATVNKRDTYERA